eukprot:CAMPEP_0181299508 /NCGR_PEP_ID=MMETSP1101-20121128/6387_1 /TAXON_ID=46948 /ORGANISM="Rhodomonas abbreviata, Strain Caron Lab Isolate" /LENGTH=126 /DNA_ID=CAMNT_0023404669 /DNA_START=211 /DNA_END=588 /DNA_ORIENTATION=+
MKYRVAHVAFPRLVRSQKARRKWGDACATNGRRAHPVNPKNAIVTVSGSNPKRLKEVSIIPQNPMIMMEMVPPSNISDFKFNVLLAACPAIPIILGMKTATFTNTVRVDVKAPHSFWKSWNVMASD